MRRTTALLMVCVGLGFAYLRPYAVEPLTASMSGYVDPELGVSQTVTACFDSLAYCELFTGEGSEQRYYVEVLTYPGGVEIADGYADDGSSYDWIRFDLTTSCPESIIRGAQLEFRFTREGQSV